VDATSQLKALEVLGVLTAGGLFVWWQFRDLAREKKKSQEQEQQRQQRQQRQQLQQLQQQAPAAAKALPATQADGATDTAAQDPRT
jgi:type II secretory pathway pseudopilin PulG